MNIFKKNYNNYYEYIDNLLKIFENSVKYFYTSKNSLVITDETFKEILSKIIDIYKKILNSPKKELHYKETKIKDDVNSNFYILFNQDQYIETVKILKTIFDIYQYLCDNNDKDLKEKIHYTIYDLLLFSSSKEDNQAEVNYILDRLFLCMLSDKNTLTIYYNFYTIVFDRFRQEKFNNIYLTSFNKYALNILKHLLDIDNMKAFKCVVDISINKSMDIYDSYGENIDKLKINKFRELFLKTTSFALYKKNYEALDILFNFHTPKDYTVFWENKDILPHSLKEVFEWVYNNNIWVEELEDHHGIASYYEKLIYLLILRALYNNNNISKDTINLRDLENINFSDLHRIQKFNLKALKDFHPNTKYNEKDLEQSEKEVLSVVNDIFNNNKLLDIIGINEDNIDKIKNEFIDALKIISKLANEMEINIIKKSQCSNEKINNVRNEIFKNYQKNNNLLSIFNQYNLISNDYYNNFDTSYIGYNVALSKEIFIDNYGVSFVGMEADFSEGIYRRENLIILDEVRKKVQQKYLEDLENVITKSENKEDLFIILNYADLFNLRSLQKTMNITLKDKYLFSEEEKNTYKEFNLNNFVGILMCNNISIPVYSCFMGDNKSQLFLLSKNREKFGSVIEYIYNGEDKEYFDEQTKLFCKLSEFEDKKRVLLQLYKKIDINLSDSFEGYMISLKDTVY